MMSYCRLTLQTSKWISAVRNVTARRTTLNGAVKNLKSYSQRWQLMLELSAVVTPDWELGIVPWTNAPRIEPGLYLATLSYLGDADWYEAWYEATGRTPAGAIEAVVTKRLIAEAAHAQELFDLEELEAHADSLRESEPEKESS